MADQNTIICVVNHEGCIHSSFPFIQHGSLSRVTLSNSFENVGILSLGELIEKIDDEIVSTPMDRGVIDAISKNILKDGYSASLYFKGSV